MKFTLLLLFLTKTVLADTTRMQAAINWISSERNSNNSTLRDLSNMNQFSTWLEDANQYGCWCYFNDVRGTSEKGFGKSKPVSELDGYCKQLHNGYECATMDFSDCEPRTAEYELNNAFFLEAEDVQVLACAAANS